MKFPDPNLYVPQPFGYVVKGFGICDVIHKHYSHSSSVVWSCDGVETLLSSSIPDLQLDLLSVHLYCFDLEIDANCGDECCVEGIIWEPKESNVLFIKRTRTKFHIIQHSWGDYIVM